MSETSTSTHSSGRRRPRDAARDFLRELRAKNPKADRRALTRLYLDRARDVIEAGDDADALDALVLKPLQEWISANIVEAKPKPKPAPSPEARAERTAAKAALVAEMGALDAVRIETIVARRLLEYEMMDGRALGDLTGADCRNLAERHGVFFHVLSEQLAARAKVRNHFSELDLQALARHHKLIVA